MPQDLYVSASWREIPILDEVLLGDVSPEGAFVATEAPLPVGTMLILARAADDEIRMPARVIEVREVLGGRNVDASVPGMRLVFEAASGMLTAFLEGRASGAGEEADLGDQERVLRSAAPLGAGSSRASGDYAEISTSSEGEDAAASEGDAADAVDAAGDEDDDGDENDDEDDDEDQQAREDDRPPADHPHEVIVFTSLPKTAAGAMDSAIAPQASGEIDLSQMSGSRYASDPEEPDKVIVEVDHPEVEARAETGADLPPFDDTEGAETKVDKKNKKRRGKKRKKK